MYPRSKQENFGETTDMLPLYAYLNKLFRRTVTHREGDRTKILTYNKNILAVMAPNANWFEFSIFDFIWEEINAISENPLKSYGYAPYLMHMIEIVTAQTFFCEKEHQPLRIKNDLRAPVEDLKAAAPYSSPPRAARGRGQQGDKPPSPIQKNFSLLFGMCKSQHSTDVRAQYERRERKKITKSVKEIHTHLNLQPHSPPLLPRVKNAQKLSPSKKGLLALMKKLRCNSGTTMRALAALALTMVSWLKHPHLTLLLSTPLLWRICKMLKKAKTMSEASRRPP
jgi:hypothetical protein